jgi:hypothetical protein
MTLLGALVRGAVAAMVAGTLIGAGVSPAAGQGDGKPAGAQGSPQGAAVTGPAELPLGWSTAPRADGDRLGFPRSLLQRDTQFGIDLRLALLPGAVLVLMAVLGAFTMRAARRE